MSATTVAATPEVMSASTRASLEKRGCLEASVLSVYDLPFSDDVPKAVTLSACGMTVSTGPPLARHRDRNSFRFAPSDNNNSNNNNGSNNNNDASSDLTKLVAPLRDLYQSTLTVKVAYADPSKYLEAELPLRQLRIHEQKWLILNLSPPKTEGATEGAASSSETAIKVASSVAEEDMSPPPTIRIKFRLSGPYRTEVAAAVNFAMTWFGVVDKIEGGISGSPLAKGISSMQSRRFNKNLLLVPAVPLLAVLVAASPLVAGLVIVAVPFLLPLALILVGLLGATLLSGGVLYSSTKAGRGTVGTALTPLVETLVISRPGQALVYDTGPRPTPVSVCKTLLPKTIWAKLWISLIIDLVGSSSYLLPVVGEGFDLAWAPAQTILIMALYDATSPNLKYLSFMEEALPFTDIVPSASIGWACEFLPLMWNDHATKNDINLTPEVTRAVAQLVSTAAKVVKTRTTPNAKGNGNANGAAQNNGTPQL